MRTAVAKLTPELRSQKKFRFIKIAEAPASIGHGVSKKEQELPFLQPGVPHSEPRRHRVQPGDFHPDRIDV